MRQIKVLVVDDSALMRSELKKIIERDPDLTVVATARHGGEVLDKIGNFDPDVVTMDINMPVMDGLTALKKIMQNHPIPVLMISSLTSEGAEQTLEALSIGAFDFVHKPSGDISLDIKNQENLIREKIKIAGMKASRDAMPRFQTPLALGKTIQKEASGVNLECTEAMIGIGVSTGGPRTLMQILPKFPAGFPGAILIAQHMPEKFTKSFALRLDSICPMRVKEAEDGEIIQKGSVYVAPGGYHMEMINRNCRVQLIKLIKDVPDKIYKPSVDVLFASMNRELGDKWTGVLLTGMGADGAVELTKLRKKGGHTIAESEKSCVVFGMPAKAIEMNGAEYILDMDEIAPKLLSLVGSN